jgi:hypothetical protein
MVRVIGLNMSSCIVLAGAGLVIVGEGTNSDRRDGGSFRDSLFQIPVPGVQGKVLPPAWCQLKDPAIPGLVFVAQGAWSVAGLVGLEGADDR